MALPEINKAALGIQNRALSSRQYMQPGEQEVLVALVQSVRPEIMVEIGVNAGLTARAVLNAVPGIKRYFGVDIDDSYQFEIPAQAVERLDRPGNLVDDMRFELRLRSNDRDAVDLPDKCDVMFIDGDHGRRAVKRDTDLATAMVRDGGMIIWHDYGNQLVEVTPVLDELRASGRNILSVATTWLAFEQR